MSPRAKGPFKSSRDVCASGLIEAHGIASVSVAGHPEGHPFLEAGRRARRCWRRGATGERTTGNAVDVVTQFCFESAPILQWIGELDARGIDLPVIVGLAGPATPATLTKFALRCGIGNSMRALRGQIGRFGRLLTDTGPDDVIAACSRRPRPRRRRSRDFTCFRSAACARPANWLRNYERDPLRQPRARAASATGPQNP